MLALVNSRLGAGLAGVGIILVILSLSHVLAFRAGRAAERQAVLARSIDLLRERNAVDEKIRQLDAAGLCRALGGRWVPDEDACI